MIGQICCMNLYTIESYMNTGNSNNLFGISPAKQGGKGLKRILWLNWYTIPMKVYFGKCDMLMTGNFCLRGSEKVIF